MINNSNFISIQGWMPTKLNLSGNDLMVYAIIYGFSQDGESSYSGSIKYLQEWLNVSKPTIIRILKGLVEKNYIIKEPVYVNNVKYCKYRVNFDIINDLVYNGTLDMSDSESEPYEEELEQEEEVKPVETKKRKTFKKPSVEEVEEYCNERNNSIDAQQFVDYYDSRGWQIGKSKIKDWKACVRTWERNQFKSSSQNNFNQTFTAKSSAPLPRSTSGKVY